MTRNYKSVSAVLETLCQYRLIIAGFLALAMLLPAGAFAVDSAPKQKFGRSDDGMPLPPIPYLDSMRWMDWKPSSPVFKIDTLLLPDSAQPGALRLPSDYVADLSRVS